jgi:hypothetical protein
MLVIYLNVIIMKNANAHNKPSPADTTTKKPLDNGHKSVVQKQDKVYHAREPHGGDIAKKHENEEQPMYSVNKAPKKSNG